MHAGGGSEEEGGPEGVPVDAVPAPSGTLVADGGPAGAAAAAAAAGPTGDVTLGRQLRAGAAPATRADGWIWLIYALLGLIAGQLVASILALVVAAATGHSSQLTTVARSASPPEWYIVATLCGLWVGFGGAPWLASATRGTRNFCRDVGLRFRWADLLGIPIGVACQFLVVAAYLPFRHVIHDFTQRMNGPSQKLTGGSHGAGFVLIALLTVVGAPFFEELFFRGLLLRSLARLFGDAGRWVGPALAVVVTGVVFGAIHAEGLQFYGLALVGVVLSFLAYRTGRLGMSMLTHASFNLVAVLTIAHWL